MFLQTNPMIEAKLEAIQNLIEIAQWNYDHADKHSLTNAAIAAARKALTALQGEEGYNRTSVAQYLVRTMWDGAELGIGNSSLRDMTPEQYFEINKGIWLAKADALIAHLPKGEEGGWVSVKDKPLGEAESGNLYLTWDGTFKEDRYWKGNHFEGEHLANEGRVTHYREAITPPTPPQP